MEMNDKKIVNMLGVLTIIIMLLYVGISSFSYISGNINFETFTVVVGPIAGTLLGYWIKGK